MDAEDHYIYRSFIVYSPPPPPPVLQVGMLKTTIYTLTL